MAVFTQNINPLTGKLEWIPHSEDYDFTQEIARSAYADMLHDEERNRKYLNGLRQSIALLKKEGKIVDVLDIGTGTGLLSMMAVTCGVDSVTACEAFSPVAECAKRIIESNGFKIKINLVGKRSTELEVGPGLDMEKRANLLVTEVFDTELIGEGALETFMHAKEHLLTPDALIVPSKAVIYAQVISSEFVSKWNKISFNMNENGKEDYQCKPKIPCNITDCMGSSTVFDIQLSQISRDLFTPLSAPLEIFKFDWSGREIPLVKRDSTQIDFTALHCGTTDAIFMWWDVTMDQKGDVMLSCAPYWAHPDVIAGKTLSDEIPWRDHWMQAVYFPPKIHNIETGQSATLISSHDEYSLWFEIDKNRLEKPSSISNNQNCTCGLHGLLPRSRIGQYSDTRRKDFYFDLLCRYVSPNSVVLVLSDVCLWAIVIAKLGASHVYVKESQEFNRRLLQSLIDVNGVSEKVTVLPDILTKDSCEQINLVFSEPFFTPSLLPWNSLLYAYYLDEFKDSLSESTVFLPDKMEINVLPVHFKDLHKIRTPLETCCGFKMGLFDKLIDKASLDADENVEPQPLWEYPTFPLFDEPVTLYETTLGCNIPAKVKQTKTIPVKQPKSSVEPRLQNNCAEIEDKCLSELSKELNVNDLVNSSTNLSKEISSHEETSNFNSPSVKSDIIQSELHARSLNGVAMWCDWHFGDKVLSFGPIDNKYNYNTKISWDPYTRQGVYFFPPHVSKKDDVSKVTAQTTFDPEIGTFAFDFSIE